MERITITRGQFNEVRRRIFEAARMDRMLKDAQDRGAKLPRDDSFEMFFCGVMITLYGQALEDDLFGTVD